MADNIFGLPASASFTVDQALNHSVNMAAKLGEVLVIGVDENDALYVVSSKMTRKDALWLLETAKGWALDGGR